MGNLDFFAELNATNRAHCAAHGFTSAELYGTPPSAEEYETSLNVSIARLNAMGPLKGMSGYTTPRPAPAFHAVIEYARPVSLWDKQDITPYYDEQRAKYPQAAGVWTGD